MSNDVLLKHRERQEVWYLVMKEDGSLWTEPGSKAGAHRVFASLAHATAEGWKVQKLGLPKEDLANEGL